MLNRWARFFSGRKSPQKRIRLQKTGMSNIRVFLVTAVKGDWGTARNSDGGVFHVKSKRCITKRWRTGRDLLARTYSGHRFFTVHTGKGQTEISGSACNCPENGYKLDDQSGGKNPTPEG